MRGRVTVFGLMGLVGLAGTGLAALRTASALWASVLFTAAFFAIIAAMIGAVATRGRERATCGGFAVACGLSLWAAFIPLSEAGGVQPPPLLTSLLLIKTADSLWAPATLWGGTAISPENVLYDSSYMTHYPNEPTLIDPASGGAISPNEPPLVDPATGVSMAQPMPPFGYSNDPSDDPSANAPTAHRMHHYRIGHTLTALILGLGGAALGRRLARSDERNAY